MAIRRVQENQRVEATQVRDGRKHGSVTNDTAAGRGPAAQGDVHQGNASSA